MTLVYVALPKAGLDPIKVGITDRRPTERNKGLAADARRAGLERPRLLWWVERPPILARASERVLVNALREWRHPATPKSGEWIAGSRRAARALYAAVLGLAGPEARTLGSVLEARGVCLEAIEATPPDWERVASCVGLLSVAARDELATASAEGAGRSSAPSASPPPP